MGTQMTCVNKNHSNRLKDITCKTGVEFNESCFAEALQNFMKNLRTSQDKPNQY
tara:strand:- start:150 stop:311 length:162 start_codon:yes stop_codon:yes gene_type:complete